MKRTMNNSTRVASMKKLIMNDQRTIPQAAASIGISESYAYALLKGSYKTETGYNKLLAQSRANAKAQKVEAEAEAEAKAETTAKVETQPKVEAPTKAKTVSKMVIVVEPGYLMAVLKNEGKLSLISFLRKNRGNVYIPQFLLNEMRDMGKSFPQIADVLVICNKWGIITRYLSLEEAKSIVFNRFGYKNRSVGIVALARQLRREGNKVEIRTSSWEVMELSELQEAGIEIVKVHPVEY